MTRMNEITLWDLRDWDGADGRFNRSIGALTADWAVAEEWKASGTGREAREISGVLVSSLAELGPLEDFRARQAALAKLSPRERALLGLPGPESREASGLGPVAQAHVSILQDLLDALETLPPDAQHPVPEGTDAAHLAAMCRTAMAEAGRMPDDKLGRWVGYIQGCMASQGLLYMQAMRERTRPVFRAAWLAAGIGIPPTISASES